MSNLLQFPAPQDCSGASGKSMADLDSLVEEAQRAATLAPTSHFAGSAPLQCFSSQTSTPELSVGSTIHDLCDTVEEHFCFMGCNVVGLACEGIGCQNHVCLEHAKRHAGSIYCGDCYQVVRWL